MNSSYYSKFFFLNVKVGDETAGETEGEDTEGNEGEGDEETGGEDDGKGEEEDVRLTNRFSVIMRLFNI